MPHSSGRVARTREYASGGIDGLYGGAVVDSKALCVEDSNVARVGELPDRKKGALVELGNDVGSSCFRA